MSSFVQVSQRLKSLLERVIRDPQLTDIEQLNGCLTQIDGESLQILQNVILQQVAMLLDSVPWRNRNELKTNLMECLCTILARTKLRQAVAMKTMLVVMLRQLYDTRTGQLVEGLSEEFKMVTLRGLTLASMNVQPDLVEEVYVRDNLSLLSQVLFVCVSVISGEQFRKLRVQAVECIMATLQIHDQFDFSDKVLRCQVAELLFIVLPKLLVALVSVVNGDEKQGKILTRTGIKALGRVLGLIFEDYDGRVEEEDIQTEMFVKLSKEMNNFGESGKNVLGMGLRDSKARQDYFSNTCRSREWLLEAEKKVNQVLNTIGHLRGAEEDTIRLEFARMNAALLEKCVPNMPTCSVFFLESLLALSQDESNNISSICQKALTAYPNSSVCFGSSRLDELFYESLKTIPRCIYRGEESDQIARFRLLNGYFNFMTDAQLNTIISNQEIVNQIVMILVAGAELDQPEELVRREYVSYRFEYVQPESKLDKEKRESRWIVLRNFHGSDRCRNSFLEILYSLQNRPETLSTILSYILEDLFTSKLNINGYLFLLSELIPSEIDHPSLRSLFGSVFAEILQDYHWQVDLEESTQISDLKFNILHICLSLRLIARFCRLFRGDFRWQLYDVLRHILPLSGSNLNCVNEAAEITLDAIATSLQLPSIQELIFQNLDYVSQHITRCLKRTVTFAEGVQMLESVLRFVPYESSAVLESTISPIVMAILEGHDQRMGTGRILCLRVLQIFVRAIRYRYRTEAHPQNDESDMESKLREKMEQLKTDLDNKLPSKEAKIDEVLDPVEDDSVAPDEDEDVPLEHEGPYQSEEDKLPPHIRITVKILTVNFKYLSSGVPEERIIALGTLNEGIFLLSEHENQLLPLVHQIWFNFAERFADPSPVVMSCAFDLLISLGQLAKDFIRKRTLDDVLPRLNEFMRANVGADFSALQTYKLQRKILAHAPTLVSSLKLNERQLDQVLNVGKLYLTKSPRRELQQLAREFFDQLALYDPGAVFVKLNGCGLDK
ncbi:TELO2-interacting protein 1 homolog [Armigeres subalbatus]|uniref:TELO2-interacting protein 1 homolog n=1 Tax=Armigeres subalbatus TaxID=124917 RepID=UPI002ED267ED